MSDTETVAAWLAAVNAADADALAGLSDPEIEILGPRGAARGVGVLRRWLARAGLTMENRSWFARGGAVVVAQWGVWRSPESGEIVGEAEVASRFRVSGGRVAEYERFDDLAAALARAGLGGADRVQR
jgi:hypothetical protein